MNIKKKDIKKIYSLTPLQEGMLLSKMRNENDTSYIIQNCFPINHGIDPELMNKSLELLSEKHEVLKTILVVTKSTGKIWQVIPFQRTPNVKFIDIYSEVNENLLAKYCEEDFKKGFDPYNDNLMRCTVFRFCNNSCYVLLTIHHAIMDGWCSTIIFSDLFEFYARLESGESHESIKAEIEKNLL